ncbi:peroxidase superfamily protein, partial [Striga asiatica]
MHSDSARPTLASCRISTAYSTTTTCRQYNERDRRYTPYSWSAASDQHRHEQGYLRHRLLGATMLRPPPNTFRASALPADLRSSRTPLALPAGEEGQEICPEEDERCGPNNHRSMNEDFQSDPQTTKISHVSAIRVLTEHFSYASNMVHSNSLPYLGRRHGW